MAKPQKVGSIEISEDMPFQERSWRVQRFGWAIMVLITLAALAGVFGGGPLAYASVGTTASGLNVQYEKFTRLRAESELAARISPDAAGADSTVRLWIDRLWLDGFEVKSITPEPEKTELISDQVVYTFRLTPGSAPGQVRLSLEGRTLGISQGRVGLDGGPTYKFTQVIYP